MSTSFVISAEAGAARAGLLFGTQATPACLILTRNGAVPHITPAQLNQILASVAEPGGAAAGAAAPAAAALGRQLMHVCALDM